MCVCVSEACKYLVFTLEIDIIHDFETTTHPLYSMLPMCMVGGGVNSSLVGGGEGQGDSIRRKGHPNNRTMTWFKLLKD